MTLCSLQDVKIQELTGIMDHSIDLSIQDFKKSVGEKKGMDRSNNTLKRSYKFITADTSAIWQHVAHTTNQHTSTNC